ncbi:MAG: hypothetical protein HZC40_03815 [Chloroflexi bacterium]|nr:hypothetical protein [Chloroflexota bacterium]
MLVFFCACGALIALATGALSANADARIAGEARFTGATELRPSDAISSTIFLPLAGKLFTTTANCGAIVSETYHTLAMLPPPTDRPAEAHADLNLALRGYVTTTATLAFVDIGGGADPNAPQLPGLFQNNRTPTFSSAQRVYDWNWMCNCRGNVLTTWDVTLIKMATTPGEIIRVPASGYDIGTLPSGYEVTVLYASATRITLKYTRNDNVILGYTLHLEDVCVEPGLLNLYNAMNIAGRASLPALFAGQGVGRAMSNSMGVALRDSGTFLDPRSRKDWWVGR